MAELIISNWNIEDSLSGGKAVDAERMHAVVDRIKSTEADIVVLPEAFSGPARVTDAGRKGELLDTARASFESEGYKVYEQLYNDTDGRKDRHGFALLTRVASAENPVYNVDLTSRQTIGQRIGELGLMVVGLHLDDRNEARRLAQVQRLVDIVNPTDYNLFAGDFNAMHRDDPKAKMLRMAAPVANVMPKVDPGETAANLAWLRRKGSLAQRLAGMATGDVMSSLAENGYIDADPSRSPSRGPVNIDHVVTNFASLGNDLFVTQPVLHEVPKDESDHHLMRTAVLF